MLRRSAQNADGENAFLVYYLPSLRVPKRMVRLG